jgi:hypothetical protein
VKKRSSENWKPVVGYQNYYEISEQGIVKSIKRNISFKKGNKTITRKVSPKILSTRISNRGYVEIRLSKNRVCKTKGLHVLLAEAFIPNPFNKPCINHKNGKKTDNSLQNLEWVTYSENTLHAYRSGLFKHKGRLVIDIYSGKEFMNSKEASLYLNINYSTLRQYLNGRIKKNPTGLMYKLAA